MDTFDIAKMISDSVFGICVAVIGLIMLVGPYDKIKEGLPKAPSKNVVKILGAVIALCGIAMIALSAMGIM